MNNPRSSFDLYFFPTVIIRRTISDSSDIYKKSIEGHEMNSDWWRYCYYYCLCVRFVRSFTVYDKWHVSRSSSSLVKSMYLKSF